MPVNPAAVYDDSSDNQFTSPKLARMGMGTADIMLEPVKSEPHIIRRLLAEFVGDTIFVFIGSMSFIAGDMGFGVVPIALAHGLTIAVLIMSYGHISGAHFNPAVTLGVFIGGGIRALPAVFYVVAQLLGGCLGALLARACTSYDLYTSFHGGMTETALMIPGPDANGHMTSFDGAEWWQGIICELILTFILVNSVLMTAVDTDKNVLAPLAIGLSLTLDICAAGVVTSASMNPARTFGPCVMMSIFGNHDIYPVSKIWRFHYIYWVGPILGSSLAGMNYRLFMANDEKRWLL